MSEDIKNVEDDQRHCGKSLYLAIGAAACMLLAILLWVPSLITSLYTYPVQDDFWYAVSAKTCMQEGHNLLAMSFIKTVERYQSFRGCYTASFLMYLFSGIIDCSVRGIRVFQFVNIVLFMGACYLFVHALTVKMLRLDWKWTAPFFLFITACLTSIHYFTEHEDLFWFNASVVYLMILSFMLIGEGLFIYAVDQKNPVLLAAAAVFGFLASGGSLNITAFCCILYLLTALWGMTQGKRLYSVIGMGTALLGALVNAACPANFSGSGESLTAAGIGRTMWASMSYLLDRYRQLSGFPVFLALSVALALLCVHAEGKSRFRFPLPLLFTLVMGALPAVVVFPVMLGYSTEIYKIMDRSIFISDLAIYLFLLMILLYWRGWISRKFGSLELNVKIRWLTAAAAVIVMTVGVGKSVVPYIPVVKMADDFRNGVYKEYSDWVVSVYTQVKESQDEVVTVVMPPIQDTTCLINPKFYIGIYDYEQEYANRTIAEYYGKKALYLLMDEDVETEN